MNNSFGDEEVQSSATANSFGDEEVQMQQPGMVTAFKRGNVQANMGREAFNAYNLSQEIDRYKKIEQGSTNPAEKEMARMKWEELQKGVGNNLDSIRSQSADASLLPQSPAYQRFNESVGFKEGAVNFLRAPGTVIREVTAESIGGQAKALPLLAGAGIAGGVPGLVAATAATSLSLEANAGLLELLTELKVDVNDPAAVSLAMASPEFRAAKANKMKKAATIATVDAATAGIAGVKLGSTAAKNVGAQIGVQTAGGGAGEALGSILGDEEISAPAVIAEMVAGTPGALVDVGTLTLNQRMNLPRMAHVAGQAERELETGLTDVQEQGVKEVTQENKKPKLTANQSKVVIAAQQNGVDPTVALAIAGVETGGKYNFDAKNPASSAGGIFQIIDSTWEGLGGGDRNDPQLQIQRGMQLLKQNSDLMRKELGREPTAAEVYLAHMFGAAGAKSLVNADPNMSMLEAVKQFDPKNANDIVRNNAMTGLTVAEAREKWAARIDREIVATGGNPEMNLRYRASKEADEAPTADTDYMLEDLDSMLADFESQPLTPEDIDAALAETEISQPNPIARVEADLLQDKDVQHDAAVVAEQAFADVEVFGRDRLLADHTKDNGKFDLTAASKDIESRVRQALGEGRKVTLVSEGAPKQIVDYDRGLKDEDGKSWGVRQLMQAGEGVPKVEIGGLQLDETQRRRADSGVSIDEAGTRVRYDNPNDAYAGAIGKAPIVAAMDDSAVGSKLNNYTLKAGEVAAVGVESDHTPLGYMKGTQQLIQDAISRFAPNARVALTFQTETQGGVSSFAKMKAIGSRNRMAAGRGLYKINMRNATNLGVVEGRSSNPTTLMKIASAAWHEVGHVVADEQMTQNMTPELKERFQNLAMDDYFTDQELATLPMDQAQVLREYNELKWQVLNDPNFTIEDFGNAWLSPWKLAHGLGMAKDHRKVGMYSFVKKYAGETVAQNYTTTPAKHFAENLHKQANNDILSPHEYMAEQMARYAYSRGLMDDSNLAREFFSRVLAKMREFFQMLKRGGDVAPGIAFAEWMDSLTKLSQSMGVNKALPKPEPVAKPVPLPKNAKKAKTLIVEDKSLTEHPPVLPPSKITEAQIRTVAVKEYTQEQQQNLQLLATDLKYMQTTNPSKYQHYMELVRNNRLEDFYQEGMMDLPDEIADKIRYDTDVPGGDAPWRDMELGVEKVTTDKTFVRALRNGTWGIRRAQYFVMNMRQMAYKYADVAGLQSIELLMSDYKAFKSKLEFKAVEVADQWGKLGKEQHGRLEKAQREEHASGENIAELRKVNGVMRFVSNERLQQFARERGLDDDAVNVWLGAKNAHLSHINALYNTLAKKLVSRFPGKPKTLHMKTQELAQLFEVIRNTPFLPQTRFGEYALHVKEKGPDGDKVVHVEFFETQSQRDEGLVQLRKAAGPERKVVPASYSATSSVLRTLPPQLLSTYAEEFALTEQEKKEIRQIADAITNRPQLRKYSTQLAGITGANKDLHKNFAEFMGHSANNIAKLHYKEHFTKGLLQIQADMHEASDLGDVELYDTLNDIRKFASKYVDHMMSPADEWQKLRAFVVVKMLWGNIKTAVANMSSLINLWSLAATQQGLIAGTANVGGATLKVLNQRINSVYNRVLRQKVEGSQVYAPDTRWALDQAKSDGLLDESFAAQLAKFSQSSTMSRMNFERGDTWTKKLIWMGMQPQHQTEVFIREVTLINQFENYMREGMTKPEAYRKARSDTYRTQGDNSIMNRPAFMRGKAASVLIFYGFIQNQVYLLSGAQERARNLREAIESGQAKDMTKQEARAKFYKTNKLSGETTKMWLAWSMLGGMMGVPGAENVDDLLELVSKKFFGTRFSLKEHAFELAKHITDNARQIGFDVNPRSLVHGMGADFDFLGLGPKVDFSASLSMGNLAPFGGAIGETGNKEKFMLGALGPLGATVNQFLDIFGDDPSMLKKSAFFMPSIVNTQMKAYQEWDKGVRAPNEGRITVDRETGELRDLTTGETLIRLIGFNPEIIAANKELHWMQRDKQQYWTTRRNMLVTQIFSARLHGDREAIADTDASLEDFNKQAPDELKITGKELRKAIKRRDTARKKTEAGEGKSKRFRRMDEELRRNIMGTPDE